MQVLQDFHKTPALIVGLVISLTACSEGQRTPRVTAQAVSQTEALLTDAALTEAAFLPEVTSRLGLDENLLPTAKSRLSDISQAAFERQRLLRLDLSTRLGQAPFLPDDHPLARDLLITRLALRDLINLQTSGKGHLSLSKVRPHTVDPFSGLWLEGPQTLIRDHIIETPEDAERYILRMAALADGLHDTRRRLIADAATGHLPPRDLLSATRERLQSLLDTDAFEAIPVTLETFSMNIPAAETGDHEARMQTAREIFETDMLPAYADLLQTLSGMETQAPIPLGLWTQPGGVTLYRDLVHMHADPTTDVDALWPDLTAILSTSPIPPTPEDQASSEEGEPKSETDAESVSARLAQIAPGLFARRADPLTIIPETGLQRLIARYDNRRPAMLEYNPIQISLLPQPLQSDILSAPYLDAARIYDAAIDPAARRSIVRAYIQDDSFKRAWQSYYTRSRNAGAGREQALQLYQATLAKADIGLHTKRWSTERTQTFLTETAGFSPTFAKDVTLRLAANPGHAVGVHVHFERFRSLEARARQVLGTRFDASAFYAALLSDGPRPLTLVERDVEAWYEAQIDTP
ncbi:MAG: DUF885 family protein [Pseudomonadota bacterium]